MSTPNAPINLTPTSVLQAMLRRQNGRLPGSKSVCGVCGKEDSRNAKSINDKCPTHKEVHEGTYVEQVERINKLLGMDATSLDQRKHFNAQIEWYSGRILKAREEHEKYVPEPKEEQATGKAAPTATRVVAYKDSEVGAILRECLTLMGAKASAEYDPVALAKYVKGNITLLLNERK
jgi:hypothetical protein